jgi:prepilin-type N-terminal cleavage/methylation domain-containing protein
MRRTLVWWPRDRRQAQGGQTLVEVLVAVTIMGLILTIVVGTFSTGLLQASLAKRNTAAVAVVRYELDQISGAQYGSLPAQYSDCFATESVSSLPQRAPGYQSTCPSPYTLRVDVCNGSACAPPNSNLTWSITVISMTSGAQVGKTVQIIRAIT